MKTCLFPIYAYMVWCSTWSKNLGRSLTETHLMPPNLGGDKCVTLGEFHFTFIVNQIDNCSRSEFLVFTIYILTYCKLFTAKSKNKRRDWENHCSAWGFTTVKKNFIMQNGVKFFLRRICYAYIHYTVYFFSFLLSHVDLFFFWKTKGQLNVEWIYEFIVSSKIPTKNYKDFCPTL